MELIFLLVFARFFLLGLYYLWPVLAAFVLAIVLFGLKIGRSEGWSRSDAIYYAFIIASTVGYGDLSPRSGRSKFLAIIIALCGLLLTGIVVAVSLQALTIAFKEAYGLGQVVGG